MDAVLIQQNAHWQASPYDVVLERAVFSDLIKKIKVEEILVLLGIRRAGKSTLFKVAINYLIENKVDAKCILYVNLDDPYFTELYDDAKKLYSIVDTAEKITGVKVQYLFLDEIQNVEAWEKFVKSVYDSQVFKKIFITGSNSKLLSGKYASLLTGRYLKHRIYPLSFREICLHDDFNDNLTRIANKPSMLSLTEASLQFGSYPMVYLSKDEVIKRERLISYYEVIIYKDCINNNAVRNVKLFLELAHYLISNPGAIFSYTKLATSFDCSDNTIKNFIAILEQSYLIRQLNHFSFSLHKQAKGNKKCYVADNGFIYANAFQFFDAKGPLFENLVFVELQKMYGNGIYFYKDRYECDFIVQTKDEFIGIQVCYKVNEQNREREVRGLLHARAKLHVEKAYIISFDQEEEIEDNIKIVPFWKFFNY